jgi:GNAT superfamily N-acetyltransferase
MEQMTEKVDIVRVDANAVDELIAVCRESFPDSLWWNGPRIAARAWWLFMLSAPSAEAYEMYVNNRPVGFFLIVSDLSSFNLYVNKISLRDRFLFTLRFFGLMVHPGLMTHTVKKLIKRSEKREYVSWHDKFNPEDVVWGDLFSIIPKYRRAGLAKQFMRFAEQRTIELKKEVFAGNVEPDNLKIISLVESLGYRKIGQTDSGLVVGKRLQIV